MKKNNRMTRNETGLLKKSREEYGTDNIIRRITRVMKQAALEAGRIQKRHFEKNIGVKNKKERDLVTDIDIKCDKKIREIVKKNFPEHNIISEELEDFRGRKGKKRKYRERNKKEEFTWIIDPIDGTNNYAHKYPVFCCSIGVMRGKNIISGAVYNPLSDELFWSVKGKGAYLNNKKIRVSDEKRLEHALVATGFPYEREGYYESVMTNFKAAYKRVMGLRRGGSAALDLCYVAAGRIEAYYELNIQSWDICAGILIVEEAGGKVTKMGLEKIKVENNTNILATNKIIHENIGAILESPEPEPPKKQKKVKKT